jgi:hypothetical protein
MKDSARSQQIERWASNQVYIALGTFMTAAALLEVDTCAIEGFDPLAYDRILNLADSPYRSCVVCAAGYRDSSDKYASLAKVRYAQCSTWWNQKRVKDGAPFPAARPVYVASAADPHVEKGVRSENCKRQSPTRQSVGIVDRLRVLRGQGPDGSDPL